MHFTKTIKNELTKLLIIHTIKMRIIAIIAKVSYFLYISDIIISSSLTL